MYDPTVPSEQGFWEFIALRQHAWHLRQAGGPRKPSSDWALRQFHFPNVYRELDTGTVAFREWTCRMDLPDLLFSAVAYRLCNRLATFKELGFPSRVDGLDWVRRAQGTRRSGFQFFTGRHLTPPFHRYCEAVTFLVEYADREALCVQKQTRLQDVFQVLKEGIPGVANFFAWQITCDLLESGQLKFSENDWCQLGPGPLNAIQMIHGTRFGCAGALKKARILREHQFEGLAKTDVQFVPPPGIPEFTLKNIEHALCEYYRYVWTYWNYKE